MKDKWIHFSFGFGIASCIVGILIMPYTLIGTIPATIYFGYLSINSGE